MKTFLTITSSKLLKVLALLITASLLGKFAHATCTAQFTYRIDQATRKVTCTNLSTGNNLIYTWTGTSIAATSSQHPVFTYPATGNYNLCLKVTSATDSTCNSTFCTVIRITGDTLSPCKANWSFSDSTGQFYNASTGNNLLFTWTFGDGTSGSTLVDPVHHYPSNGTYNVCLTVRNALDSTCINTKCSTIVATNPSAPCVSQFTCSLNQTTRTVTCTNLSTGPNLRYLWNYGDGHVDTSANPVHTYTLSGSFSLCLTVRNALDSTCINTKCTTIVVNPINCVAQFSYTIDSSMKYHFNSTGSSSGNHNYLWTFGDGSPASTLATPPAHTFPGPGNYNVCLRVTNKSDSTCTQQKCSTIVVPHTGSPCVAKFYYTVDSTGRVHFFNISTGASAAYFMWKFGDGGMSNDLNPVHNYGTSANYTACLYMYTATCSDSVCQVITGNLPNTTCNASFTYSQDVLNPFQVLFQNHSTSSGPGTASYFWTFGDGNTSTSVSPGHVYAHAGTYTVTLTITKGNCSAYLCDTIILLPTVTCNASFIVADSNAAWGSFFFQNTSSGNNLYYSWDFGDGHTDSARSSVHQYAVAGTYNVCLTVRSLTDSNCFSRKCTLVHAGRPACNAEFGLYRDTMAVSYLIHFYPLTDTIGGNYQWNFGDSTTSSLAYPVHVFPHPGIYRVCLTVNRPHDSCHTMFCDSVIIGAPPTGIADAANKPVLSVYPNPFHDLLNIAVTAMYEGPGQITVADALGRTLLSQDVTVSHGANQYVLDLATLGQGVYLVELNTGGNTMMIRVVK